MTIPTYDKRPRFRLEVRQRTNNALQYVCDLPYQQIQYEQMLNSQGQNFRCNVPYRGYPQVNQKNLFPGMSELWFFDVAVDEINPVFAGPLWDVTGSSSNGMLNLSAQDPLSYLAKRVLKTFKSYNSRGATYIMNDLVQYAISQGSGWFAFMNVLIDVASSLTSSITYQSVDRNIIADLLDALSKIDNGVDYYFRTTDSVGVTNGGKHNLHLVGDRIKSSTPVIALSYPGNLDGHSVQYNGQTLGNEYDIVGANGVVGSFSDSTAQANYQALYQVTETSDQVVTSHLVATATRKVHMFNHTRRIPALTTRSLVPIKDFDFGSQFNVYIDDEYVQENMTIRTIGWQNTIGQGDALTTVIYTKDNAEVT